MTPGEARRIAEALASRALEVAQHLFPNGKQIGREWCVGSIGGEPGESLKINLENGKWKDFATQEKGGDLLDLWARKRRGGDISTAMREAAEWAALPAPAVSHPRHVAAPATRPAAAQRPPSGPPAAHPSLGLPSATWTYLDAGGQAIALVMRFDTADGKEYRPYDLRAGKWTMPDPRPLYRLQDISKSVDPIVFAEGEQCADALAALGILSTSTMGGAQAVGKADLDPLRGRVLYLWRDADTAGESWAAALVERLRGIAADVYTVPIPEGVPEGWDVADAVAEGWDAARVRELIGQAERVFDEAPAATPDRHAWRMWALDELDAVPPVEFALAPLWVARGVSVIGGASGSGKSVVALDLALRRATGKALGENSTQAAGVVYIAAEGFSGLAARARAWAAYHRIEPPGVPFAILQAAPQLLDAQHVAKLLAMIAEQPFRVHTVILDTLARTFVGRNENSEDMGAFVDAAHRIADAIEGHVCILHHTPLADDGRLRGHTSLHAAADTVAISSKLDSFVDLKCTKQKDGEDFAELHWQIVAHAGSIVAVPVDAEARKAPAELGPKTSQALAILKAAGGDGLTFSEWHETSSLKVSTFKKAAKQIRELGLLQKVGSKYKAKD